MALSDPISGVCDATAYNERSGSQAPIANAWELRRVWPRAALAIVDDAGHAADQPGTAEALIEATDRFAAERR